MSTLLELLPEWILRSSILIAAIALSVTFLRKRAAASTRHALWTASIVASLALPLLALSLPAWHILPKRNVSTSSEILTSHRTMVSIPVSGSSTSAEYGEQHGSSAGVVLAPSSTSQRGWLMLAVGAWGIGAGFCILRLLVGHYSISTLVNRHSHKHHAISNQHSHRIHLSARQIPPMVYGLFRPTILLPHTALDWPQDRLDAVIRHEKAHVRRWDLLWDCFASILCALQWFNPFVWLAARQMRAESEHACDDAVILDGIPAKKYAGHLLEVASTLQEPTRSIPAAAMATGPEVERRLRHALDTHCRRRKLGKGRALGFAILLAPFVAAVALAAETEEKPAQPVNPKKKIIQKKALTVVLDAGHGGKDTGANLHPLLSEKDLTLKLALALRGRLEKAGFRVVLTRFDDSTLSLAERIKIADKHLGGVLLSLHFHKNHQPIGRQHASIYTSPLPSQARKRFSTTLVDTLQTELPETEIENLNAHFGIINKPLITSALFQASQPEPDKADAELEKIADALASGISTWSKLPPPPVIKAGQGELDIEADDVNFDEKTNQVLATGNVKVRSMDEQNITLGGERAEYDTNTAKFKLWAATIEIEAGDGTEATTGKAGIITYDQNAGTVEFSNDCEIIRENVRYFSKSDETSITLNLSTGSMTINGPSVTQSIEPDPK